MSVRRLWALLQGLGYAMASQAERSENAFATLAALAGSGGMKTSYSRGLPRIPAQEPPADWKARKKTRSRKKKARR